MPILFAKLHGERLGDWAAAIEVAEGVLGLEQFQPLLRAEAHRLLGRAHAALGNKAEAKGAVERALPEFKAGQYVWLERMALRDLERVCEAAEAKEVQARLQGVEERMSASVAQLSKLGAIM